MLLMGLFYKVTIIKFQNNMEYIDNKFKTNPSPNKAS